MGKRHHYIPCMLLSRFGEGSGRDAKVWVFDKSTGDIRHQKVQNVAYEKFLYRVPASVVEKDAALGLPKHMLHVDGMEDVFQLQEDVANGILDAMEAKARLPEDAEMEFLLWFVLMLESRNPEQLERIRQIDELTLNAHARVAAHNDPTLFGGRAPDIAMPFDENRHILVGHALKLSEDLLPYMRARKWTLRVSTSMRGGLVCGDVPLNISLTVPRRGFHHNPAHAVNRTMVSVPLSSSLLLTGEFEGKGGVAAADERWVGYANAVAFSRAERFVYSRSRDFPIMLLPSLVPVRDAVNGIFPVIPFDAEGFSAKAKDGRFKRPRQLVNPDALPQIDRILAGYAAMDSERHTRSD